MRDLHDREETVSIDESSIQIRKESPCLFLTLRADHPLDEPWRHGLDGIDEVLVGRGEPSLVCEQENGLRRLVVRVADSHMSSSHARLRRLGGTFELEDLGSKNGTFVNGAPQQRV